MKNYKSEYAQKLKDPRWQRKRLEVMSRDGFRCNQCHSDEKELHVHHKYYERGKQPWEYPGDCYQTLCDECHRSIHDGTESRNKDSLMEIERGFTAGNLLLLGKSESFRPKDKGVEFMGLVKALSGARDYKDSTELANCIFLNVVYFLNSCAREFTIKDCKNIISLSKEGTIVREW